MGRLVRGLLVLCGLGTFLAYLTVVTMSLQQRYSDVTKYKRLVDYEKEVADLTYKLGEVKTDSTRLGNDVRRIRRVVDLLQSVVENENVSAIVTNDESRIYAQGSGKFNQDGMKLSPNAGKKLGEHGIRSAKYGKNYRKGLQHRNDGFSNELENSETIQDDPESYQDYDKNDLNFGNHDVDRISKKVEVVRNNYGRRNNDQGVDIGVLDRRPFADKVDVGSVDQNDLLEGLQDIKDVDKIDYGRYEAAGVKGVANRDITDDEESFGKSQAGKLGRVGSNRNVL